ncbi:Concanavalin A-like lectin/glucanase, subgroup [Artemisia annua]|uniref:Concanavalin A-like lectin/glucanase, subgroup n=1 Tax=Artemisia annua TaxID=35608 RepID=A0A2U1M280_ARTAN|nr:Concanavalin A-like lectin/glucanase, subgroup [Artemisia annua]
MTSSPSLTFLIFLLPTLLLTATSDLAQDTKALTSFITQIPHASRYNWNTSQPTCSWTGVTCDASNSSVIHLRIPAAGLVGTIPSNTLGTMTSLRVLSLHTNALSGPFPDDFENLGLLRSLYVHGNRFSGEFPPSLTRLTRLVRVDLSNNGFTGVLPFAVNNLTQLNGLFLQNNKFSGRLPNSVPSSLTDFNVSGNDLNGSIPLSLAKFPVTAFSGNVNLCGTPLPPCNSSFFPESPSPGPSDSPLVVHRKKKKKLSTGAIVAIAVGSALVLALLLLVLLLCLRKKRSREDLLRASAEVLGKGSVGTSYKAVLEEGTTVVVKRLKDVVVSKKEFDGVMEGLGKMKNENVVPIRAYYYSKDEKLLASSNWVDRVRFWALIDYNLYYIEWKMWSHMNVEKDVLQGSRGSGRTPLDWDHRLRIALSAAKGVAYLHVAGKVVHGNIKSSNILLRQDSNKDASVSDFGLNTLFGGTSSPNTRVTGYRAPEVLESRKVTFKSDVYSFGVLLLELLTGKAPNQASLGEEGIDLPRWVQSVVREEWTAEVFDVELMRYQNIEEEMVQLLQIAMACVSTVPDQRPAMQEVVRMMEDMNRAETDDGMRQSSDDPSKGSDGHTPPTESRNSPNTVTP